MRYPATRKRGNADCGGTNMVEFIKRLFCNHEYKDISGEVKVFSGEPDETYPVRFERTFVCCKCLKKKKIKY